MATLYQINTRVWLTELARALCRPATVDDIPDTIVRLKDLTSAARFDREGDDLASRGLYLDMPPLGYHVFEVEKLGEAGSASLTQNSEEIANERGT